MSGHARLKQALVLRDALADTLGLELEKAIAACAQVEDEIGSLRALEENHWRDALRAFMRRPLQGQEAASGGADPARPAA